MIMFMMKSATAPYATSCSESLSSLLKPIVKGLGFFLSKDTKTLANEKFLVKFSVTDFVDEHKMANPIFRSVSLTLYHEES